MKNMTLQELTHNFGITEIQIKYYQTASLLPQKLKNAKKYDYTTEDIRLLKNITILRKAGAEIEDIRYFFENKMSMENLIIKAAEAPHINEYKGSKTLRNAISEDNHILDTERLWEIATKTENCFPLNSVYERSMISYRSFLNEIFGKIFKFDSKKESFIIYIAIFAVCIAFTVSDGKPFWHGLITPFIILGVAVAVFTPIYFINKFSARAAAAITITMVYILIALLLIILILVLILVANGIFHFM